MNSSHLKLFQDLVLLCKNNFGFADPTPDSTIQATPQSMLALLRVWTGTPHTTYKDAVSVYMSILVQTPLLCAERSYRFEEFLNELVYGSSFYEETHPGKRAMLAIRHLITTTKREDVGFETWPEIDKDIVEATRKALALVLAEEAREVPKMLDTLIDITNQISLAYGELSHFEGASRSIRICASRLHIASDNVIYKNISDNFFKEEEDVESSNSSS